MKTLTIKGVTDVVHARLTRRAKQNHRSLNGEILALLETAAAAGVGPVSEASNVSEFLLESPLPGSRLAPDQSRGPGRKGSR